LIICEQASAPAQGKLLLSTIAENSEVLQELLGATPQAFQPSIPHLIYQYNFFVNYPSQRLSQLNPEIAVDGLGDGKKGYSGPI